MGRRKPVESSSMSPKEQQNKGSGVGVTPSSSSAVSHTAGGSNNHNHLALAAAAQLLQQHQQHGQSSSTPANGNTSAQSAAETFQTLASIMSSSAMMAAANKHLLPNSTPVSSLLPQLPSRPSAGTANGAPGAAQHHPQQNAISSQLAALLSGVNAAPKPPPNASQYGAQQVPSSSNPLLRHSMGTDIGGMGMPNMQNWNLEQLQQHVKVLEQIKQPIPQTVSLLLADAKRKEEKRNAKRIANRKSASTSRARKKAYVQEMTELNARLKRQALILSLLPDMVIVIEVEGNITFCSAQVERVLRYEMKELEGKNLTDVLMPSSREKLKRLIKQLLGTKGGQQKPATNSEVEAKSPLVGNSTAEASEQEGESNITGENVSSGAENSTTCARPSAVSEPSFPLSVVQVEAKLQKKSQKQENGGSTDNSDNSLYPGKQTSSLTVSNSSQRSAAAGFPATAKVNGSKKDPNATSKNPSSDLSNSSSLSTNAKNVLQANTNLERNVRIHNKKFKSDLETGYKDDVTGAEVTANNASARLSSLQHRPETSSSEDDSGYRESNDSREETSSSVSESSDSNGRRKPIAPTCLICLIRKDMTTIWCEVTSSIRTKEAEEDIAESVSGTETNKKPRFSESGSSLAMGRSSEADQEEKPEQEVQKELLLCLRPVRDGDPKIQKKITFEERPKKLDSKKRAAPENSTWTGQTSSSMGKSSSNRPFKKRGVAEVSSSTGSRQDLNFAELDTDAAESLMLMNRKT